MKIRIFTATLIILVLTSCSHRQSRNKPDNETPKALDNNSGSMSILYKRGSGDLVASLYNELVEKTPALKELENKMDALPKAESDSAESFTEYNDKVSSYYLSAKSHTGLIKDSVLREKIKTLIENSLTKYNGSVSHYTDLLKSIETKKNNIVGSACHFKNHQDSAPDGKISKGKSSTYSITGRIFKTTG